ncbi:hypothetical protein KY346_05880 [Candidatus Woesearchaeota archaeon]|nr:hypothetical protein [Candidatus Woesearchaeota archaeon]
MGVKKFLPAILLAVFLFVLPSVQGDVIFKSADWVNETFLEMTMEKWNIIPSTDFYASQAHEETSTLYKDESLPIWKLVLDDYGISGELGWYDNCNKHGTCERGVCKQGLSCNADACVNVSDGEYLYTDDDNCEHYDTREYHTGYKCEVYSATGGHPVVFYCRCNGKKVGAGSWCDNGDGETYNTRWVYKTEAVSGEADVGGLDCGGLLESKGFKYEEGCDCCYQENRVDYKQYYKYRLEDDDMDTLFNHTRCWVKVTQARNSGNDFLTYAVVEGTPTTKDNFISCLINYSDWKTFVADDYGNVADKIAPGSKLYFDFAGKDLKLEPECHSNSDCGENYWTGDPECCNGDGWHICQAYHGYECVDAGTNEAFCFEYDGYKQTEECFWECKDNMCGEKPEDPEEPSCENSTESCCTDANCASYCDQDFYYFNGHCPEKGSACWFETTHCSASDGEYCNGTFLETRDYLCGDGCEYNITNQVLCPFGCENGKCKESSHLLETITCKDEKTLQYYERNKTGENYTAWRETDQVLCIEGETCVGPTNPDEFGSMASCIQITEPITFATPITCETHKDCPFKYMMCVMDACVPRFRLFEDFNFDQPSDMINPYFADKDKLDNLGVIGKIYKPPLSKTTISQHFEKFSSGTSLNEKVYDTSAYSSKFYLNSYLYDETNQLREVDFLEEQNNKIRTIEEATLIASVEKETKKFENIEKDIPKTKYIVLKPGISTAYSFVIEDGNAKLIEQEITSLQKIPVSDAFRNSVDYKKLIPTTYSATAEKTSLQALEKEGITPKFLFKRSPGYNGIRLTALDKSWGAVEYVMPNGYNGKYYTITPNPFLRHYDADIYKSISADDFTFVGTNSAAMGALFLTYEMMSYYDLWENYVKAETYRKDQADMCGTDPKSATDYYDLKAAELQKKYSPCNEQWERGNFSGKCDEFIAGAELENFFFYYFQDICTKDFVGIYGPDFVIPDTAEHIKKLHQTYLDMPLHNKCFKTLYFGFNGKDKGDNVLTKIIPSNQCVQYNIMLPMYQKTATRTGHPYDYIRQLTIEMNTTHASFIINSPSIDDKTYTTSNNQVQFCLRKSPTDVETIHNGIYSIEIKPWNNQTFDVHTITSMWDYVKPIAKCFEAPKPKRTAVSSGGGGGGGGGSSRSTAPVTQTPPAAAAPPQPSLMQKWAGGGGSASAVTSTSNTAPKAPEKAPEAPVKPKIEEQKQQEPAPNRIIETGTSLVKRVVSWLFWFTGFQSLIS